MAASDSESGSFHLRPEPDFALVYAERVELLRRDLGEAEARARAIKHVVAAYYGARPSEGVAMSHSAPQTAMGTFRAEETEETANIGRVRPEGFLEAFGREGPTPASARTSTRSAALAPRATIVSARW